MTYVVTLHGPDVRLMTESLEELAEILTGRQFKAARRGITYLEQHSGQRTVQVNWPPSTTVEVQRN